MLIYSVVSFSCSACESVMLFVYPSSDLEIPGFKYSFETGNYLQTITVTTVTFHMDAKKEREGNFSRQDSLLLVTIMGELNKSFPKLSNHQVAKHRFTNGITSQTKKDLWKEVASVFNASASFPRSTEKLEKKWFNLTSKHRLLYSDFLRDRALTGGGVSAKKFDFLTEALMNVIGKDTVAVTGATGTSLDTTFNKVQHLNTSTDSCDPIDDLNDLNDLDMFGNGSEININSSARNSCMCNCHIKLDTLTVEELKKRKLILQIQLFEKKTETLNNF